MTRRRHPFEGRTLAVLGGMHRHGVLEFLVVLPDGSKALMSSAWTDAAASGVLTEAGTLGSLRDLLRAVTVVAAGGLTLAGSRVRRLSMSVPDQLALDLPGVAARPPSVLDGLSDHDHAVVVRVLARLMVKTMASELAVEEVAGDE